jgi:uncharacterized membrane protein YkvA (DUF1232 family)
MFRLLKLWHLGARDLRLLWFGLSHRSRPAWLIPATAFVALYAFDPFNFVVPVLGAVDDFVLLPLVLHLLVTLLPADIRAGFQQRSSAR